MLYMIIIFSLSGTFSAFSFVRRVSMDTAKTTTDVRDTFEQLVRDGKGVKVQHVSRGVFSLAMTLAIRQDHGGRVDLMDLQHHFAREVGRRLGEFAKSTCGVAAGVGLPQRDASGLPRRIQHLRAGRDAPHDAPRTRGAEARASRLAPLGKKRLFFSNRSSTRMGGFLFPLEGTGGGSCI